MPAASKVHSAVSWRVFDQALTQAREGFEPLTAQDAQNLLEEALAEVRAEGLQALAYEAFKRARPKTTG